MKITVYYHDKKSGSKGTFKYDAYAIKCGTARQVIGEDDARGNGLPLNAPLVQIRMNDGGTATFDANNVTIMLPQ